MNMRESRIRRASSEDFEAVCRLLTDSALPAGDLTPQSLESFYVTTDEGRIVGVAGLEVAGDFALLRSVTVQPKLRRTGLGEALVGTCLSRAHHLHLKALYLIPNDEEAGVFFANLGFSPVRREAVPAAICGLAEFTHLCPQTHPCMHRVLDPGFSEETLMKKLEVFDPAMCCSTGVCGVDVDPVLAQFAADLKWVEAHGVTVSRHNLGQEPQAFAANPAVVKEMEAGMDRLPILAVDGHIVSTGMYPSRQQLVQKLGIVLTTEEKPRIKIGAAGGCCDPESGCC